MSTEHREETSICGKLKSLVSKFRSESHVSPNNLLVNSYIYGFHDLVRTKDGQVYPRSSLIRNAHIEEDLLNNEE